MNQLAKKIAKKTGLGPYEADALLKAIGFEIVETLKAEHRFNYEGLGIFYCVFKNDKLTLRIRLTQEAYDRLNKIEEGERKDEIIFD